MDGCGTRGFGGGGEKSITRAPARQLMAGGLSGSGLEASDGSGCGVGEPRWVHHTSWLWDFKEERMKYLAMPE
jgi:hypothetical protein